MKTKASTATRKYGPISGLYNHHLSERENIECARRLLMKDVIQPDARTNGWPTCEDCGTNLGLDWRESIKTDNTGPVSIDVWVWLECPVCK